MKYKFDIFTLFYSYLTFIELFFDTWLKYTFGPYFCQNYLIWSLFSLFVQFGSHFCKIAFNRVLLANGVKIVNGTVTRCNCLGYVSNFGIYDGTHWHN